MEIQISETSDWQLFAAIAEVLEHGLNGSICGIKEICVGRSTLLLCLRLRQNPPACAPGWSSLRLLGR
ncbi:hypothetical protein C1X89_22070 [Pseudomonas sp. GP01-A8]|nr:hypothetical protein C1X90_23935 [Pseudomonas sp. GP01-A9]PMU26515.1 hypothetical protein C1X88_21535 [Pseudomonas sp. GP01-A13]PMU35366.1 hypothetical protein C1X89_22070 [Pseudomonas sp. GP01-A8]PMU51277.1 hypothetical protein C1X87_13285 [Pseudomonas sp. GP01-A14]PMU52730.1 hypothetical protein C1X85_17835 [Pseudomonas sp. GP01-A6]PMU60719.1 hypothetical protein C1X86_21950 [Pseudomonas sp. GP01-A3]PMU69633.1 hypothetical protein C1X84_25385 [Pseudomonas sp. GP01-A1]PMU72590.1 hypothet